VSEKSRSQEPWPVGIGLARPFLGNGGALITQSFDSSVHSFSFGYDEVFHIEGSFELRAKNKRCSYFFNLFSIFMEVCYIEGFYSIFLTIGLWCELCSGVQEQIRKICVGWLSKKRT
jgi:hypothetical protein